MAAAAGVVTFIDPQGNKITRHVYFDDTAGNPVRWSAGGAKASATSPTYFTCPSLVKMIDMVMDGATAKTITQVLGNDMDTGNMLLNSLYLAAVVIRPPLSIGWFAPGTRISLIQLT